MRGWDLSSSKKVFIPSSKNTDRFNLVNGNVIESMEMLK